MNNIIKAVALSAIFSTTLIAQSNLTPRYTYNNQLDRPVSKPQTADNYGYGNSNGNSSMNSGFTGGMGNDSSMNSGYNGGMGNDSSMKSGYNGGMGNDYQNNMPYNGSGNNPNMPYNNNNSYNNGSMNSNGNGNFPSNGYNNNMQYNRTGTGSAMPGNMQRLAQNDGMQMNDNSGGYNDTNSLRDQRNDRNIRLNNQNSQDSTYDRGNGQNSDGTYGDDTERLANNLKNRNTNNLTANNDTQVQDKTITSDLRTVLRNDRSLSYNAQNIKIEVQNGIITLNGFVNNNGEKSKVDTLARGISGVKNVISNLQIKQ